MACDVRAGDGNGVHRVKPICYKQHFDPGLGPDLDPDLDPGGRNSVARPELLESHRAGDEQRRTPTGRVWGKGRLGWI